VFTLKHSSLTNLGGKRLAILCDHCQRKDMDKDNAPASQQIKQYNQTQLAEKFTTSTHIFGG